MTLFSRLRASAGESGLRNALGRWRQEVSRLLDSSGGIVALEHTELAVPVNVVVAAPQTTLVTTSVFTLTGASRPQQVLIRAGVNARLGTGDTLAQMVVGIEVSANGGPFAVLRVWQMGDFDLDTQYLCSTYEIIQPVAIDATTQYRLSAFASGTATDVITIDPPSDGFAYLTVQISNSPE